MTYVANVVIPMRSLSLIRRAQIYAVTAICVGALSVVAVHPVVAAPADDRSNQLRKQIGEASGREAAALNQLQAIRDRKAVVDAQVAALDAQVAAAEARLAPLAAEAARLTAAYNQLAQEVATKQAELDTAKKRFSVSAAEMYRSARRGVTYDAVLTAQPDSMVQQNKYLDQVSSDRREIVEQVSEIRADLDRQRRLIETQKAAADEVAAQAQAARDEISALRGQIEPARAQSANEEVAERQAVSGIQAERSSYERELASLQAASDSIAARLRALGAGSGSPGGCQARPVPGAVTSPFGPRLHPVLGSTRQHSGVDMSGSSGTSIHACRAGKIVIAGWQGGYGNAVVIDHGGGMATLYGHQSRIAVSEGQQVNAGDVIGYVGSTGMSTGPHLHFEVRISGNPVNPASYL